MDKLYVDQEKKYYQCIICPKLGKGCDGCNIMALSRPEIIDWCKALKKHRGLTNSYIAENSAVPKGTVDRFFSDVGVGFNLDTVKPIIATLIGGWTGEPCPNPPVEGNDEKTKQQIAEVEARHKEALQNEQADSRRRIDYLKQQVTMLHRSNVILAALAAVGFVIIAGALIYDITHLGTGFFW